MVSLEEFLREVVINTDEYIRKNVSGQPRELYESSLHILKAGGKRLRPAILIATGLAFGAKREELMPFAAGVELLHNFTLIHDDIMDNDEYRRGVPTVHKLWGVPMAILAGDLLFSYSLHLPLKFCREIARKDKCVVATEKLAWAAMTVAEGQALDMSFEKSELVSEEDYMQMIYKKTAALIESSAYIGAVLGQAPDEDLMRIQQYARGIGIAFQIVDDILGIFGKEEETGKPVYSDLREGKKTLLIIRALELAKGEDREVILSVLGKRGLNREMYARAASVISSLGVYDYAVNMANELVKKSKESLDGLSAVKESQYVELLREIADLVVKRRK